MQIILSVRELFDKHLWMEFCELRGINDWAVHDGLMRDDEEFVLSEDECKKLGVLQ